MLCVWRWMDHWSHQWRQWQVVAGTMRCKQRYIFVSVLKWSSLVSSHQCVLFVVQPFTVVKQLIRPCPPHQGSGFMHWFKLHHLFREKTYHTFQFNVVAPWPASLQKGSCDVLDTSEWTSHTEDVWLICNSQFKCQKASQLVSYIFQLGEGAWEYLIFLIWTPSEL